MKRLLLFLFFILSLATNAQVISLTTYASGITGCTFAPGGTSGQLFYTIGTGSCANQIYSMDLGTGQQTLFAGNGICGAEGSGSAANIYTSNTGGLAYDKVHSVLYFVDQWNSVIRKISGGFVTTVTGSSVNTRGWYGNQIACDNNGNLYYASRFEGLIYKATYAGTISVFAGGGTNTGDGFSATSTSFPGLSAVATDQNNNVYLTDGNGRIRKIDGTNMVSTVAGGSTPIYPTSFAVDNSGNILITEMGKVRKVDALGNSTMIAGTGTAGVNFVQGVQATSSQLSNPLALTFDNFGNLYIGDRGISNTGGIAQVSACINSISVADVTACLNTTAPLTVATSPASISYQWYNGGAIISGATSSSYSPSTSTAGNYNFKAKITSSCGSLYSPNINYYVITAPAFSASPPLPSTQTLTQFSAARDEAAPTINGYNGVLTYQWYNGSGVKVGPASNSAPLGYYPFTPPTDVVGTNSYYLNASNQCGSANSPSATVTVTPYSADSNPHLITTIVGTGPSGYGGDNGIARAATLNGPTDIAVDASGNQFIVDKNNHSIRRVDAVTRTITTIAGTGTSGYTGDNGNPKLAQLSSPNGIAIDAQGNLFIADLGNHCIRKINSQLTTITTLVGGLGSPWDCVADASGNIYVTDQSLNKVFKYTLSGVLSTVAGGGSTGDGSPASTSVIFQPAGVAIGPDGNLYFSENSNGARIRKVDLSVANGLISSVGSALTYGGTGVNPTGIALDATGNVYIADKNFNRVLELNVTTNQLSSLAGVSYHQSPNGDGGISTSADLFNPANITLDQFGSIYISDYGNNKIRKIWSCVSNISVTAPYTTCQTSGNAFLSVNLLSVTPASNPTYQWFSNSSNNNFGGQSINISNLNSNVAGLTYYYVEINSSCGTIPSNTTSITVNPLTSTSLLSTASQSVACSNDPSLVRPSFTIVTTGTPSVAWYYSTNNTTRTDSNNTYFIENGITSVVGNNTFSCTLSPHIVPGTTPTYYFAKVMGGCDQSQWSYTNFSGPITVANTPPPDHRISVSPNSIPAASCPGSVNLYDVANNFSGPFTYQWFAGASPTPSGNDIAVGSGSSGGTMAYSGSYWTTISSFNPSYNPSAPGPKYYYIKAVNSCGQSQSYALPAINMVPRPTAVVSGTKSICTGSSTPVTVTMTGTAPWNLTYFDGSTSTTVNGINTNTYNISASASKSYTATALRDANCISTPASDITGRADITVGPTPTATTSVVGNSTICAGMNTQVTVSVALTGSGPWNLTYSDGSTSTTVNSIATSPYQFNVSPSSSRAYTVTAMSDSRCSANAADLIGSAPITVNTRPTSVVTGSAPICINRTTSVSIALTGRAPWNLTYSDGTNATTVTGITTNPYVFSVSPSSTRTYSVTALSDANCTALSSDMTGSATITVGQYPTATISASGPTIFCQGNSVTLNASQTAGATYLWSNGATSPSITVSSGSINTYYSVTVTSSLNCSTTSSNIQAGLDIPSISYTLPADAICYNGSTHTILAAGFSYAWSPSTGVSQNGFNVNDYMLTPTTSTQYTVTGTDSYGCKGYISIGIVVNPLPSATITADGSTTVCPGQNVLLSTPSTSNYTYRWKNSSGYISGATNSSYLASNADTYSVEVTNSSTSCTGTSNAISVLVASVYGSVSPSSVDLCTVSGGCTYLQAGPYGSGYSWSTGQTGTSIRVCNPGTYTTYYTVSGCPVSASAYVYKGTASVVSSMDLGGGKGLDEDVTIQQLQPQPCSGTSGSISVVDNYPFNYHPNPASGVITIELTKPANDNCPVLWYDMNGREIRSDIIEIGKKEKTFPLEGISAGVYLVRVRDNDKERYAKIVVK